jgi:large subunit ribosomal protein L22
VKYSPDKMFYVARFVRGLTVDEAIKQLSFNPLKVT